MQIKHQKRNSGTKQNTTNPWGCIKTLQEKCIVLSDYIKCQGQHKNDLIKQLKNLDKEEQIKSKSSYQQEIIKIRAEKQLNRNKEKYKKKSTNLSWFFEKMNKLNEFLVQVTKREDSNEQIHR